MPLETGAVLEGDGLTAELVRVSPTPPSAVAENRWLVRLEPPPVDAPQVSLTMPDHGHGAPAGDTVLRDDGVELSLGLTMPGYWEVRLETADGVVVFPICAEP